MKLRPYLFISFLIVVLFFVLGVRYGQNIEKKNKVVDYLLSITPPPSPTPTFFIPNEATGGVKKDASTSPTLFNLKK